jgi:hypothetical protein
MASKTREAGQKDFLYVFASQLILPGEESSMMPCTSCKAGTRLTSILSLINFPLLLLPY